jgi:hypothetical protein
MISGMRSWIPATSSLASVVMTAKVRIHSSEAGSFQFCRSPPIAERAAVLHRDGIGLLGLSFDCFPLEEAVDRHDAAAPMIGVAEGRQLVHGLALGVDRLASAFGVLASC